MIKIGIDLGCSFHKIVLLKNYKPIKHKILKAKQIEVVEKNNLEELLDLGIDDKTEIAITGGPSKDIQIEKGLNCTVINEIEAIAFGGYYFYPFNERILSVSIGTGTCMVLFDHKTYKHLGGSGIGGGTLAGLANYMIKEESEVALERLFAFAKKGNLKEVDISVEDIIGGGIGILPGRATASHLGKINKGSSEESVALGFINMIATELANLIVFSAKACHIETVLLMGYPVSFEMLTRLMAERFAMLSPGLKLIVPKDPVLGTAFGAVHSLKYKRNARVI